MSCPFTLRASGARRAACPAPTAVRALQPAAADAAPVAVSTVTSPGSASAPAAGALTGTAA